MVGIVVGINLSGTTSASLRLSRSFSPFPGVDVSLSVERLSPESGMSRLGISFLFVWSLLSVRSPFSMITWSNAFPFAPLPRPLFPPRWGPVPLPRPGFPPLPDGLERTSVLGVVQGAMVVKLLAGACVKISFRTFVFTVLSW